MTKPFSPREFLVPVKAILKRATQGRAPVARHGAITLDRKAHSCRVGDEGFGQTATEFTLPAELLQAAGQVWTRAQQIHSLRGASSPVSDRTLDSHLRNLRRKLAEAGSANAAETLLGVGIRPKAEG